MTTLKCDSVKTTWTISHLTDLHDGSRDHAEQELDERIRQIRDDPYALWVGGGDYGDLVLPTDKRYAGGMLPPGYRDHEGRIPDYLKERLVERLAPIGGKCIGFAAGNHEATIGRLYSRAIGYEIAEALGCKTRYLGDRGWSVLHFTYGTRTLPFKCYTFHGWSSGRLRGRKAIQAERDLGAWLADAFFLGHDHQPYADVWYSEEPYNPGGRGGGWRIRQKPRAFINGGSWTYGQKPPSPEEEKALWRPSNAPGQSWLEGKNFRPQPPVSPVLLVHVDFGYGSTLKQNSPGKPAGFTLETRMVSPTFHLGAAA